MRHSGGIVTSRRNGYRLHVKDDGGDYERIWDDLRQGRIPGLITLKHTHRREVYLAEVKGRQLIIKIDHQVPKRFEVKLWHLLRGPMRSRIMRLVNRAVAVGCNVTADIYLVAERLEKGICREACIIQEYLPGRTLLSIHAESGDVGVDAYREQLAAAMRELHGHKLVLSDLGYNNVLVTPAGIKLIDLSWNGPF